MTASLRIATSTSLTATSRCLVAEESTTCTIETQTLETRVWQPAMPESEEEKARRLRNLLSKLPPEAPLKSRIRKVVLREIIQKVQVPHGPGNTTGSQRHVVTVDLINEFAAKSLLYDLRREGPTKRGTRRCFNWMAGPADMPRLHKFLSLEDHRLGKGKALDSGMLRKNGYVLVMVIPPFLAESEDDGGIVPWDSVHMENCHQI